MSQVFESGIKEVIQLPENNVLYVRRLTREAFTPLDIPWACYTGGGFD